MMVGLLSVLALAIDLGMLYKTKGEAQRAADAAALAGADAFRLEADPARAALLAPSLAKQLAARNHMTGGFIDSTSEVTVQVIPDSQKVRVWVNRLAVRTWFARMFGVASTPIGAVAAARALDAGSTMCVKPFALADFWAEATQDANGNRLSDIGTGSGNNNTSENWTYDQSQGDSYAENGLNNTGTGLGRSYRNPTTIGGTLSPTLARDAATGFAYQNDGGRRLNVKFGDPQQAYAPGYFSPWRPPGSSGGSDYRNNIRNCNTTEIDGNELTDYQRETGNMIGPTTQGIQDLIDNDPLALNWTETDRNNNGVIEQGEYGATDRNGNTYTPEQLITMANPRIGVVPMMNPQYAMGSGGGPSNPLRFNQFRYMFFEGCVNANTGARSPRCGNNDIVVVRFLTPAVSGTGGGTGGSTAIADTKIIRLVE
jgi:hypothetical protein